ncbi:MAG: M20/M25/M40 family metallo-hydrolase [Thermovirgaceae bacterium]
MISTQKEHLYRLMLDLVQIPSVSPSKDGENRIARFVFDTLRELPYFQENPGDVRIIPMEGDRYERHIVFAVVRAKKQTADTVLLMGHMDVVGTDACGSLKEIAFDAEEYTRRIAGTDIHPEARRDLESGEWIFGRGIADMKTGVATGLSILAEASRGEFDPGANLAVLYVCDEENNSGGMLAAVPVLAELQETEGLRFLSCINTEPTFAGGAEAGPSIYLGSIGKINPFFYFAGKETHVGEYYEGLCAAPIVSHLNIMLDGNPHYADMLEGTAYPPYGCMRQHDLRREYSATIMTRAVAFYSYLTARKMPGQILAELKELAMEAQKSAIGQYNRFARGYMERNGSGAACSSWTPKVYTYGELVQKAETLLKDEIRTVLEQAHASSPPDADERERAFAAIEHLADACGLQPPFGIVGFLPPWYPHRTNQGRNEKESAMRHAAEKVREKAKTAHGIELKIRTLFEGVSDLSYCGFEGDADEIRTVGENLPGWGTLYRFPEEDLLRLDIPVLNLGPFGKDAHKNTERIHLPYSVETYPVLLKEAVTQVVRISTGA